MRSHESARERRAGHPADFQAAGSKRADTRRVGGEMLLEMEPVGREEPESGQGGGLGEDASRNFGGVPPRSWIGPRPRLTGRHIPPRDLAHDLIHPLRGGLLRPGGRAQSPEESPRCERSHGRAAQKVLDVMRAAGRALRDFSRAVEVRVSRVSVSGARIDNSTIGREAMKGGRGGLSRRGPPLKT